MLQNNHIKEFGMSEAVPQALDMWKIIRDDWDKLIRSIRDIHKQIPENDLATLNFLEDMIESMEKEAWMVRSYNVTPTGI